MTVLLSGAMLIYVFRRIALDLGVLVGYAMFLSALLVVFETVLAFRGES